MVHELLRRLITGGVLRKAYNEVETVEQTDREDEGKFAKRIPKTAWLPRHAFSRDELVKCYLNRLKTAVR